MPKVSHKCVWSPSVCRHLHDQMVPNLLHKQSPWGANALERSARETVLRISGKWWSISETPHNSAKLDRRNHLCYITFPLNNKYTRGLLTRLTSSLIHNLSWRDIFPNRGIWLVPPVLAIISLTVWLWTDTTVQCEKSLALVMRCMCLVTCLLRGVEMINTAFLSDSRHS